MNFGIKSLFAVTFVAACLVWAYSSQWFYTVAAVVAINVLGFTAGLIVTKLFRFPTDGGYRDPMIRAEMGQDELQE